MKIFLSGLDMVSSGLSLTGFALPPKEKSLERDAHTLVRTEILAPIAELWHWLLLFSPLVSASVMISVPGQPLSGAC